MCDLKRTTNFRECLQLRPLMTTPWPLVELVALPLHLRLDRFEHLINFTLSLFFRCLFSKLCSQMYPGLPGKEGAPPPPASYPAPQQPQAPVQVVTQVQYVAAPSFGYRPVTMTCPHCQAHVTTKTQSEPSVVAWIVGGLLCFVGAVRFYS